MRAQLTGPGAICLMVALSCSCSQGGSRSGEIKPLSALTVERLDDNVFPLAAGSFTRDENGVTACYQFVSQDCLCTSEPMLVCQGTDLLTVTANGIPLAPLGGGRYLIAGNVQEGENVLALQGNGDIGPYLTQGPNEVAIRISGWTAGEGAGKEFGLFRDFSLR